MPAPSPQRNADKTVVIVSFGDDNYAMPLAVSLSSALCRLDREWTPLVYILEDDVSSGNKKRIDAALRRSHPRLRLAWRSPRMDLFDKVPVGGWYTRATLLRLMAPFELPETTERALLIDSDVVVEDDILKLWNESDDDNLVCATENFSGPTMATSLPRIFAEIGLRPDAPYFNAGIMLLNLKRWRAERITERVVDFLNTYGDRVGFMEQDGLNAVVAGDCRLLPPRWNVQVLTIASVGAGLPQDKQRKLQERLLAEPGILHFTGPRKPWHLRYAGPRADAFNRALQKSGWFGFLDYWLWVASRTVSHAVFRRLSETKRTYRARRSGARVSVHSVA